MKTQQLEVKLSNKHEEDIKKARRKSTQAGPDQNPPPQNLTDFNKVLLLLQL